MNKKKIIIISASLVVTVLVCVGVAFCILKKDNKVVVDQTEEEIVEKEEYKNELSISLEDNLPTIEDYLSSGKLEEGTITYKDENDEEIELNELKTGTYKVFINGKEVSKLNIVDEIKPELKLKELTLNEKEAYKVEDFVESCTDNSKEDCLLSFKEETMASYTKEGSYDIVVVAKDNSDNVEEQSTKLVIKKKETINTSTDKKTTTNNNTNKTPSTSTQPGTSQNTQQGSKVEESFVYGTKVTKTTSSNGKVTYSYDYSTFNGTTNSMKGEASSLVKTNANIYNEVLNFTNAYRSEAGASPLSLDNDLNLAATIRAMEIAYSNKFDHIRPDGSYFMFVLIELGVMKYFNLGENIAYGSGTSYFSPKSVTTNWRNSPGHYANMINTEFTKLGVGYYKLGSKTYYVQIFGS